MSAVHNYVWDPAYANPSGGTGGWVKQTAGGGGGGTGGPVTFPSGFNVNNWPADYAISNFPSSFSVSNFPSSFSVSNWPANQPVTDSTVATAVAALPGQIRSAAQPTTHAVTTINHGSRANATAGTALPLTSASTPAKWVTIQAAPNNAGLIAYGGAGVNAASTGAFLSAGQSATIPCTNLNAVYFDSTVAGGIVRFTYWN